MELERKWKRTTERDDERENETQEMVENEREKI